MRANEVIRGVLDLIDYIDCGQSMQSIAPQPAQTSIMVVAEPVHQPPITVEPGIVSDPLVSPEDEETRRFKQIVDLMMPKSGVGMYSNSPNEAISGIESVTTDAGGGLNGPKNPADIRADSISMYPNHQHRPGA